MKLNVALLAVTLFSVSCGVERGGSTTEAFNAEAAEPILLESVVHLVGADGTSCSGVVIGENLLATAKHCADGAPFKIHRQTNGATKAQPTGCETQKSASSAFPTSDSALFSFHCKEDKILPTQATREIIWKNGDKAFVVGFGLGLRLSETGKIDSSTQIDDSFLGKGQQIQGTIKSHKGDTLVVDFGLGGLCSGDSGAPLFVENKEGKLVVVAVVSTGRVKFKEGKRSCGSVVEFALLATHFRGDGEDTVDVTPPPPSPAPKNPELTSVDKKYGAASVSSSPTESLVVHGDFPNSVRSLCLRFSANTPTRKFTCCEKTAWNFEYFRSLSAAAEKGTTSKQVCSR